MIYQGGCHCGRIAFEVEGEIDEVVECNCSHCSKKGFLLWFGSRDQLRLKTPESAPATYTFNKHEIRHQFCPDCGCQPYGLGQMPDGSPVAAVNVRCLEGLEPAGLAIKQVDGRSF